MSDAGALSTPLPRPTPTRLQLLIWSHDTAGAASYLASLPDRQAIAEALTTPHPTPLFLALKVGALHIARLLLELTDPSHLHTSRDGDGASPLVAATRLAGVDRPLSEAVVAGSVRGASADLAARLPALATNLLAVPDFVATLAISFSTYVPLLGGFLPSDTVTITKQGAGVSASMSLCGLDGLRWRRGAIEYRFLGAGEGARLPLFVPPPPVGAAVAAAVVPAGAHAATPHDSAVAGEAPASASADAPAPSVIGRVVVVDHIGRRYATHAPTTAMFADDEEPSPEDLRDSLDSLLVSSTTTTDWRSGGVAFTPCPPLKGPAWLPSFVRPTGTPGTAAEEVAVGEFVGALHNMEGLTVQVTVTPPLMPALKPALDKRLAEREAAEAEAEGAEKEGEVVESDAASPFRSLVTAAGEKDVGGVRTSAKIQSA